MASSGAMVPMREITFDVEQARTRQLTGRSSNPKLRIDASSLEELQHEARDALIQHYGPAHVGYRARLRRRVKLMPSGGEHR